MKQPLVSIIVPTRNSADTLGACLESIKNQTYKNIEVIIVDQSSTDDTQKIAKRYKTRLLTRPEPKFYSPPSTSRNLGAKGSKGYILYHLDSDMELSSSLIDEAVSVFAKKSEVGALIVHEEDVVNGYWSKCKALERRCYWGNENIESARVVRRDIFNAVGGYNESISSGEDFDIHRRYKKHTRISFCQSVALHNLGKFTFGASLKKKYDYGKTAYSYFKHQDEPKSSVLRAQLTCFKRNKYLLLQKAPFTIGMLILKSSEIAAGGLGYLAFRKAPTEAT